MSDYNRTTRICPVSQIRPELRQAVRDFFKEHELGDLTAGIIICSETISERKSSGKRILWLDDRSDRTIHTGMLLTPEWLIWVRSGDQSGTRLTAANLKDIQVKVYASNLTQDTGLEVNGFIGDSKGRVRGYIGMESELIAQKFCDEVRQAIDKVNPPTKKKKPWWLGG